MFEGDVAGFEAIGVSFLGMTTQRRLSFFRFGSVWIGYLARIGSIPRILLLLQSIALYLK